MNASSRALVDDSAFKQMMLLMIGFCRNSNCTEDTVRGSEKENNFSTMCSAFTIMCPNFNNQLSPDELQAYGIDVNSAQACPGTNSCTNAHDPQDLRRRLFLNNGQLAYWPVLCAQFGGARPPLAGFIDVDDKEVSMICA